MPRQGAPATARSGPPRPCTKCAASWRATGATEWDRGRGQGGRLRRPRAGLIGPNARRGSRTTLGRAHRAANRPVIASARRARPWARRAAVPVVPAGAVGRLTRGSARDEFEPCRQIVDERQELGGTGYLEPARSRGARRSDDHQAGKPDARLLGGAGQCPQARRVAELQPRQIDHHAQWLISQRPAQAWRRVPERSTDRGHRRPRARRRCRRDARRSPGSRHRSGSMLPPRRTATHQARPGLLVSRDSDSAGKRDYG